MERRRITFAGRVQGVGFRAAAASCAAPEPVTGWVRNEPDGSVAMEIQGSAGAVETVLARLRARMGGNIRSERMTPLAIELEEPGFEIRR